MPDAFCQRKRAGAHGDDGEAVEHERGRVIGEAFAFQHDDQPARQSQLAGDGERRHHVGRRDDGAEQEADRPVEVEQVMRGGRDRAGGEHHAAEREQRDRPQVEPEFAPAHGDAGRIDQRRQQHEQHHFRRQLDLRQAGDERHANAGDHQQDRGRDVEPLGGDRDRRQHRQHEHQRLRRSAAIALT